MTFELSLWMHDNTAVQQVVSGYSSAPGNLLLQLVRGADVQRACVYGAISLHSVCREEAYDAAVRRSLVLKPTSARCRVPVAASVNRIPFGQQDMSVQSSKVTAAAIGDKMRCRRVHVCVSQAGALVCSATRPWEKGGTQHPL